MGKFNDAMTKMAAGIDDLSKLDVVTFQGVVTLESDATAPLKFSEVMKVAIKNTNVKVKVLASTQTMLDGDIIVFYDKDISEAQQMAHAELVLAGAASRKATIDFVKSLLGEKIADL